MTNNLVVVQARMGSHRLPGKSMMHIGDRPMIDYLIESLLKVFSSKDIVIATSTDPSNDVIRNYAIEKGLGIYSGSEDNVASRYHDILMEYPHKEYLFRICGDSPYYDVEILKKGLQLIEKENFDLVSSMPNKGYPMGCNLEVVKTELFKEHYLLFSEQRHFEHVMPYFYENLNLFHHQLIACEVEDYSYNNFKFSVDTLIDFNFASSILKEMNFEPWRFSLKQKFDLIKKHQNICL